MVFLLMPLRDDGTIWHINSLYIERMS